MCVCVYILQIYIHIINLYKFLLIFCILRYEDASDDDLKNRVLPDCKKKALHTEKTQPLFTKQVHLEGRNVCY